jgi:putative restriction endonuclease
MPALAPSLLVRAVNRAFDEGDASAILVSDVRGNPRRFLVQHQRHTIEVWIYIWTLTHGGGAARPEDEYRIQLTGVLPPIQESPGGPTLLMGYEPNIQCFAGFDLRKHRVFSTQSPSIQIPITTLHNALQHGLSFTTKGNDEIAIGVRPDSFVAYCLHAEVLHRVGADAKMTNLLSKAVALEEVPSGVIHSMREERQRVLREVVQLSRDSSFRRKVIHAYDRRCAVTRMQLRLIDAAHILPIGAVGSTDEVANGLCLSPTYHRAFDGALIYLDRSLRMQINSDKEKELVEAGLAGGLDDFKSYLGMKIHLPEDRAQWPAVDYIKAANEYRRIG